MRHRACLGRCEALREVAAQRARCYVRRAAFGTMAHTPQALVFSPVQRASAPPARAPAIDDDKLEHAAQAIRPSWPGAPVPTRRAVVAPTQRDFASFDEDARPDDDPFRSTRRARGPWLFVAVLVLLGGGAWAYMSANKPSTVPPSAAPAARTGSAPAAGSSAAPAPAVQAPVAEPPQPTAHRSEPRDVAPRESVTASETAAKQAGKSAPTKPAPSAAPAMKAGAAKAPLGRSAKAQPLKPQALKPAQTGSVPARSTEPSAAPSAVGPDMRLRVSDFDPPPAQAPRRAPSAVIRQNPYD